MSTNPHGSASEVEVPPIRVSREVPVLIDDAFDGFALRLHEWWPAEYTWSGEVLESIGIEPRIDGLCFERGPHGFVCNWGRAVTWEPPMQVTLLWQINPDRTPQPDPVKASEVVVHFLSGQGDRTRIEIEHRHFDRHGDGAAAYREAMASAEGWPRLLDRYAGMFAAAATT
jgi:hypothetical protein